MSRVPVLLRRHVLPLVAAAVLALGLAGCGGDSRQSYATEADEPYYRQAEQMKRSGRQQEALSAYLRVIEKRGDDAPESHLEAGLVYAQHIRDPIAAIYHFRKYLSLRPNSAQAPLVKQRIDAAIRDFARTLPAQPLDTQVQRVDLIAALDKLKLENDILKQQVADLQAGRETTVGTAPAESPVERPAPTPANRAPAGTGGSANNFSVNLDTMPTVRTRPAATRPEPVSPPPTARSSAATAPKQTPAAQTPQPARGARTHTVRPGDTLSSLSQRYYGNRSRWRDIYQANRATMRNEGDLKVGAQIMIPQ
ncbi:MAG: LysM peptidoglycan-binding domain-containing protein [Candidatus Didemnitutus sp.]|nr:LysM peptidoglycan-binding domain-containing protein [Candidatus Didemnitutus sp.]